MKSKLIYKGHELPFDQHLNYEQERELKRAIGVMKWIKLNAGDFAIKLDDVKVKDYPLMKEVWAVRGTRGIFIGYLQGYDESLVEPNDI